jgi:flagellar basal body rod protein FlgC
MNLSNGHALSLQCYTQVIVSTLFTLVMSGCGLPARTDNLSIQPTTNAVTAARNSAYVTLALDDAATEWEFVQWLRAAGVHVEKDANGDDRIFDSPACRAILVRYRRMMHVRLGLIAQNIANINSTHDAQGAPNPYRRRFIVANGSGAFQVREDPSPFLKRYLPGHADADAKGYVLFPNVDLAVENVNANETLISYGVVTRILMHLEPTFVGMSPEDLSSHPTGRREDWASCLSSAK